MINYLIVATIAQYENYIFYSIKNGNGLYQYNIVTNENTLVGNLYTDSESYVELYKYSFIWEKQLFLIPDKAENVAIYDIQTGTLTYDNSYNMMVEYIKNKDIVYPGMYSTKELGDYVYIVGTWSDSFIFKMNLKNKEGHILNTIEENIVSKNIRVSLEGGCWDHGKFIFTEYSGKHIYEVNVNSEELEQKELPGQLNYIVSIYINQSQIYVLENNGFCLHKYNAEMTEHKIIFRYKSGIVENSSLYTKILDINGLIYLLPNYYATNMPIKVFNSLNDILHKDVYDTYGLTVWCVQKENKLILYSADYNKLTVIESEEVKEKFFFESEDGAIVPYLPNKVLKESGFWSLNYFLHCVSSDNTEG